MKTLVLSMISIAATVAAMTACTSESDPVDEVEAQVPINLNAGVLQTKAVIDAGENGLPTNKVDHVHFYRVDVTSPTTPSWDSPTKSFTGSIETTGEITVTEKQYYATNGNNTFISGLYLGDNITTIPTITTGKTPFTIDGTQDILFASGIDMGNRKDPKTTTLSFEHQLTQFKFVAKTNSGIDEITDINIALKNAKATSAISLSDGTLDTWTGDFVLTIPSLTAAANGGESTPSLGYMLQPNLSNIAISVTADKYLQGAQDLTITAKDGGTFEAGKSYVITVTFTGKEVSAKATIGKWIDGTNPDAGTIE